MVGLMQKKARSCGNLRYALQTLEKLNIVFRGPFITPRGVHVYVVEDCVLTDIEILELGTSGRLTLSNIESLRATQRVEMAMAKYKLPPCY